METGTLKHVMISLKLIRIFRYILAKIPFISILKDRIKHKLGEKKYLFWRNKILGLIDALFKRIYYNTKVLGSSLLNSIKIFSRHTKILGVVNWEPITLYLEKGHSKSLLDEYYNPADYFDQVHIFAYQDKNFNISPSVHVHGFFDRSSSDELAYLCRKYRVKILRNYDAHWSHLLTLNVKRKLRIPAVISLHDIFFPKTISGYDHIFAYVEWLADKVRHTLKTDKASLLLNRIDHRLFKPSQKTDILNEYNNYDNKLLSVGRLHEGSKNYLTVIKAMHKVIDIYPSTLLLILGDGPDKESYLQIIDKMNLSKNICILPFQNQTKVVEYLNWADFFVLVNNSGDIGKSIAEALIVGLPIVVTGEKGNSVNHLRDGFNAKLVPWEKYKDPATVADAIIYMIEHKKDFDAEAIREDAIRVYNYDYWMNEEASVYKRLMRKRYDHE